LNKKSPLEEAKRHRFSALINGICIGVGFNFIVLGIILPLNQSDQITNGLLAIIGGIVVVVTGGIMEVYHQARLPLLHFQELNQSRWNGIVLICKKCGERTGHVLTKVAYPKKGEKEEIYECLTCGTTKRIYGLTSAVKSAYAQESMEVTVKKEK